MHHKYHYQTPVGSICVEDNGSAIVGVNMQLPEDGSDDCETELLKEAHRQLTEYFGGRRRKFDLPIEMEGTDFQIKVWQALCDIPYGETRNYGEIASAVGSPKASRAVGGANHKNQIMIIVPCHRVIGANGSLVGFGGGLPVKEYLLNIEKQNNPYPFIPINIPKT